MRPLSRDKFPSLVVLAILAASFLVMGVYFPPAKAYAPNLANANYVEGSAASSLSLSLTIAAAGDTIAVFVETVQTVASSNVQISHISSTAVSGGFTFEQDLGAVCVPSAGFCGGSGGNQPMYEAFFDGTATTAGAATISITLSSTASLSSAQGFDMQFVSSRVTVLQDGNCDAVKNKDCGSPIKTNASVSFTSGLALQVAGGATRGTSLVSATAGYTLVGPGNDNEAGIFSTTNLSVTSPTTFGINLNGNSGLNTGFVLIGAVYEASTQTTVTTTKIANTGCLGAGCTGGANASSSYMTTQFNLHFYASQNLLAAAQIDNVTVKVHNVHINTATATFYVLVYVATGQPTGGNPYAILTTSLINGISNGSSDFFIHANPQANLLAGQYYAVGVMAASTKSNSVSVTGTGISLYESSSIGVSEYKFNPGGNIPPTTFFSNTLQQPLDFMYIHTTQTIATLTSTTTVVSGASTTTTTTTTTCVGCTATSTVSLTLSTIFTSTTTTTSTTTSTNVINNLNLNSPNFWFIPMLFLLFPVGLMIMVKRVADGR